MLDREPCSCHPELSTHRIGDHTWDPAFLEPFVLIPLEGDRFSRASARLTLHGHEEIPPIGSGRCEKMFLANRFAHQARVSKSTPGLTLEGSKGLVSDALG